MPQAAFRSRFDFRRNSISFFGWYKYILRLTALILISFRLREVKNCDFEKSEQKIYISYIYIIYIYHCRPALSSLSPVYLSGSLKLCNNTASLSSITIQHMAHIADGEENEQLAVLIMPAVHCG